MVFRADAPLVFVLVVLGRGSVLIDRGVGGIDRGGTAPFVREHHLRAAVFGGSPHRQDSAKGARAARGDRGRVRHRTLVGRAARPFGQRRRINGREEVV